MPGPSFLTVVRHVLSRAVRETGQALDRVGIRGSQLATTQRTIGDDPFIFDDHLSRHRSRMGLIRRGVPSVHPDASYIAPCSTLVGRVTVGSGSSVWYGAVLRADSAHCGVDASDSAVETWRRSSPEKRMRSDPDEWGTAGGGGIWIGRDTNVQDGCVITSSEDHTEIGDGVTIGHLAQIHSASVGDYSLVGMGAVISPSAKVESEAFVAAGSVVGRGSVVRSGELWGGNPARKLRDLTEKERAALRRQSEEYVKVAVGQSGIMDLGGNMSVVADEEEEDRTSRPSLGDGGETMTKSTEDGSRKEDMDVDDVEEEKLDEVVAERVATSVTLEPPELERVQVRK